MIKVLLADDHPIVRAGLQAVLEMADDIEVVEQTSSPEDAVRLTAQLREIGSQNAGAGTSSNEAVGSNDAVGAADNADQNEATGSNANTGSTDGASAKQGAGVDVVLMDLQFGQKMAGIEATRAIAALPNPPRVLVLTTYDTDADILAAVEAGASGYLLKDAPPAELLGAVRTAAAGQSALAPAVALRLMDRMRSPGTSLSAREIDVLSHVAEGRTNQQIAKTLFISEATVKSHLVHIFTKLGVDSRTAAAAKARQLGLIRA